MSNTLRMARVVLATGAEMNVGIKVNDPKGGPLKTLEEALRPELIEARWNDKDIVIVRDSILFVEAR